MIAAMMATVDPGEEVVVFEPFYENYAPDAILSGATPRYVPLRAPDWTFDRDELRAAFNERTKAIIICNPNNPTGKVFTREELEFIAALCREFDALCFTDEIYEHILYPREDREVEHISMAQLEGMRERTRRRQLDVEDLLGHGLARRLRASRRPTITDAIRKVHDFLTVGAAAPLQARRAPTRCACRPSTTRSCSASTCAAATCSCPSLEEVGLQNLPTRRRLLRDDRHRPLRLPRRRRVHAPPHPARSASPASPAQASTAAPSWARARCASASARRTRRSKRRPTASASCKGREEP